MAKQPKKTNRQEQQQEERIDSYARILQIVAILGVVAIVVAGQLSTAASPVPVWIPAGLMGVAIGISPDQFVELVKAFFTGRKK